MKKIAVQRIRITKNDFMRDGYSDCRKRQDSRNNQIFTGKHHSEMCRYRLYAEFQKGNDPEWREAAQELGIAEDFQFPARGSIDADPGVVEELLGDQGIDAPLPPQVSMPSGEPQWHTLVTVSVRVRDSLSRSHTL